ncbi:MAG: TetR/AcrR family transcriptional regulator [Agathobacter sp.]
MPKVYSEEERNTIISRLKEEANILMQEKGVKKTTVDELVKRVGIPKGTFYLFYPSKEMLLFDVSQDFHKQVDDYITAGIMRIVKEKNITLAGKLDFSGCVEELTDVILGAMEITYSSCLQVLLNPESMNLILSKLPDDVLEKHRQEDKGIGEGVFEELAINNGLGVEALVGAFMMIIFGGMYKREVGEANWRDSMRILIKGIVLQLVG